MPYCIRNGKCEYCDRIRYGADFCFFPQGCCPFDILGHPPEDMVKYRRELAVNIAVLESRTFITDMENIRLAELRAALASSYQKK
ncbi:MAG: hypothetical protein E7572_07215 [Ruminococcaceae bacterium]|nr:hypothetical protein [Oscillospiraceae bacterium]